LRRGAPPPCCKGGAPTRGPREGRSHRYPEERWPRERGQTPEGAASGQQGDHWGSQRTTQVGGANPQRRGAAHQPPNKHAEGHPEGHQEARRKTKGMAHYSPCAEVGSETEDREATETALSEEDARSQHGLSGSSSSSLNAVRSPGGGEGGPESSHSSGFLGESSKRVSRIRRTAPGRCGQGIA
jgi:hypothetical protein